jgi:hypothetical protein
MNLNPIAPKERVHEVQVGENQLAYFRDQTEIVSEANA